ncbi:MAG: extracellular solute-binding protein [Oscillospiraceae bacterium]|nr:extracellular solute-binding protein [Oscillospiraceae bacterium]
MNKKRKRLLAAAMSAAFLLGATGCSAGGSTSGSGEKVRLMVWSPSEDQSKDSGEWLQTCCKNFAAQHPEWDITFVYGVADEATAAATVAQDPEASADVFMYANDNITVMTDAQALARFGGKYEEQIRSTNSDALLNSVTLDGSLYGIPYTTNTWYMYYDTSVYTAEDVKSLDTMLDKGAISFPFTNSWYLPSFYFGNGCTLFGDGTQEELGCDFGGDNAVEVTDYLIDLVHNPNFVVDADGAGMAGLRDGSLHALFSGSWDYGSVKEILGDNLGAAALPTYELNGAEKQMYAYAGSKAIGVNSHSEYMVPAVELAIYLGSAEAQELHYDLRSVIPCNTDLLAQENIAADPVVIAQNDTFDRTSILQPFVSAMGNVWDPVANMGKAIRDGSTNHENAAEQTMGMNNAMNSNGIG